MSQENDHDFRDQHKILVLEMLTNPCEGLVTKILLHSESVKIRGLEVEGNMSDTQVYSSHHEHVT